MEHNNNNDKSFEEMSRSFQSAFGYSSNCYYKPSLPLYEKSIQEAEIIFQH